LQIHDELVYEVAESVQDKAEKIITEAMNAVLTVRRLPSLFRPCRWPFQSASASALMI